MPALMRAIVFGASGLTRSPMRVPGMVQSIAAAAGSQPGSTTALQERSKIILLDDDARLIMLGVSVVGGAYTITTTARLAALDIGAVGSGTDEYLHGEDVTSAKETTNATLAHATVDMSAGAGGWDPYGFTCARLDAPASGTLPLAAGEPVYVVTSEAPSLGDFAYFTGPPTACA